MFQSLFKWGEFWQLNESEYNKDVCEELKSERKTYLYPSF